MVPPGIRSESRLALGVTRRPGRDRLGGLDNVPGWCFPVPVRRFVWGTCFFPDLHVALQHQQSAWDPERWQPRITSRHICFCICAWILLAAQVRQSSLTILPTLLPVIDLSAKKPVYLNKQRGMEDDYITAPHLFLLNNFANQKFIFGDLSADIRSSSFIRSKDLKAI